MDYKATLTITVEGAEAPDRDYLQTAAERIQGYLSFEGETVTVDVDVERDGVAV
jgi:hypothetical protein